jgi:hypothetical protein
LTLHRLNGVVASKNPPNWRSVLSVLHPAADAMVMFVADAP